MDYVIEITSGSIIKRFLSFLIDYVILAPFIVIFYQLWKDKLWSGQSIGNKIMRLQLIDFKTGKSPSIIKVVIKNIVFLITFGLGSLIMFFNDGKRSLGDSISSTMLVKKIHLNK